MRLRSGGRCHDEQGSAALEFALVAPLLFIIVFAVIDFSRAYYTLNDLTAAVREGARYASSLDDPIVRQDEVRQVVKDFALSFAGDTVLDTQIDVTFEAEGRVRVAISDYPFEFLTPLPNLLGLSDVNISRQAIMKWERAPVP
ncbi:MAG: pilus assembly protein [Gemmatimonadota bacterium]|nr:MAG: pilus assembly protein [Gemmatimonadota bacterium]